MANCYVSPSGNNANNGAGPDASHASNKPWLTIDYAIDAMNDGDVLYIAPGIYRELVSPADTISSERILRGDPLNTQGFKDGSAVLLNAGPCIITNLLTDDVSAATNTSTIKTNGKSNLTFENLWIESHSASYSLQIEAGSRNITVSSCYLFAVGAAISYVASADVAANLTIRRCSVCSLISNPIILSIAKTNTADYDTVIVITNSILISARGTTVVNASTSGTGTYFGGGVIVQNCFLQGGDVFYTNSGYNASITHKFQIKNSVLIGNNGAIQSGGSAGNVIVEDYNFIIATTARTNVNVGSNSVAYGSSVFSRSLRIDMGQSQLFGFAQRSFLSPWNTSRTIGYGTGPFSSGTATSASATTLVDSGKSWTTNIFVGLWVLITGGTGVGQARAITANDGTSVTVSGWSVQPDNTSKYAIATKEDTDGNPKWGTATSATGTTLVDSNATWATNALVGMAVVITAGTGSGQRRLITANDATSVTVATWATNPDNTSTYQIEAGNDIWNRSRPSGSGIAAASSLPGIGAHELHEFGTKDTATKDAGDASLKLVGPGDHEFLIPVAAESTTISIKVRYDSSTYGGTDYPQAILLDSEAFANISGNTETKSATSSASDAWETLTFTSFTPSRKGVVRLRLLNRGTGADDICWFDTLGIA